MTTVTTKRSTRITFVGCCNLPQQKAVAMRDSLQTIISHLSNLHAACDDDRIKVDDKHKSIKDLTVLSKEINELGDLGKAQVDLCENEADIHQQLSEIHLRIKSNASEVSRLFMLLGNSFQGIGREATQAVNHILSIVCDTVELLRIADKYTIKRLEDMAGELHSKAAQVTLARDMNHLMELASPLARLAVDVAKLVSQRADTIDNTQVRASLENAASSLAKHTPALIMSVRSFVENNASPREVENNKVAVQVATQEITRALLVAPEFAVLFDVNYIDTELAAKLAALAASVSVADTINVAKHSRAVNAEVAKQLKLASADKTPANVEKCVHAQNAVAHVLDSAKEALSVRASSSAVSPPFLAAEKHLNSASTTLQVAVAALPAGGQHGTTTHLIKAAQDLSARFQLLLMDR